MKETFFLKGWANFNFIFQPKEADKTVSDETRAFDHVRACIDNEIGSFETETGSGLTWVKHVSYDMACNWKVFVDNYLDGGYHVDVLHKDLTKSLNIDTYSTEIGDGFSIQARGYLLCISTSKRMLRTPLVKINFLTLKQLFAYFLGNKCIK